MVRNNRVHYFFGNIPIRNHSNKNIPYSPERTMERRLKKKERNVGNETESISCCFDPKMAVGVEQLVPTDQWPPKKKTPTQQKTNVVEKKNIDMQQVRPRWGSGLAREPENIEMIPVETFSIDSRSISNRQKQTGNAIRSSPHGRITARWLRTIRAYKLIVDWPKMTPVSIRSQPKP